MSKKGTIEVFQTKITRNDRFAQMSHQEKVIEQKKREIQARLEQKQKTNTTANDTKTSTNQTKNLKSPKPEKKVFNFNVFSNDGSFLNQFKQMKERKIDQKLKSYRKETNKNDERKNSRWSQRSDNQNKERQSKPRISRFAEKPSFEPKININTSYSNLISQAAFETSTVITPQNVTGQPLLKNITSPSTTYNTQTVAPPVIAAPPVLLNIPPPQVIQTQLSLQLVSAADAMPPNLTTIANELSQRTVLATVTVPPPQQNLMQNDINLAGANVIAVPPPCMPTIELSSIPPPNPIQVHNIPQPEPINTLTIPPPAPLQVQNIPPPSPIHLNEIPNPKPLDIINIPTPNDNLEKNISDPDFIKNIPPPNKSVPPPNLTDPTINVNVTVPPPQSAASAKALHPCLPPPNIIPPTSMPPPQQLPHVNEGMSDSLTSQSILVHTVPPPSQQNIVIQAISPQTSQTVPVLQNIPPPVQTFTTIPLQNSVVPMQNQLQVVRQPAVSVANNIPSLMAQPILPPPGMGIAPPPINVNCPPPMIQSPQPIQGPVNFVGQLPPITNQMPPMNVPPPTTIMTGVPAFKDMNTGTPDYEAMASLGRMVAQCGPGIEEVVKQRKPQDPNLWFLFHKGTVAYRQYQQLVEQYKMEMEKAEQENYKPEDIYEPEMANDDDHTIIKMDNDNGNNRKRRRKSRWGDKDITVPPPSLINAVPTGPVLLSKVTRTDPALVQYAINTFGTSNLTEEDWSKAEDHYKINILYQDMLKKRHEVERLQNAGKNKYDYDSDEDVDGGTWEHKLREKEMIATQLWAQELTRQAEGKHHIGDFLPPEELKRFLEKSNAAKEGRQATFSDYKEFKIKEDNIGFKMLQKLGWTEGQGLGLSGCGITEPVNKATVRDQNQGLGSENAENVNSNDDEYDAYRKRMMLAYRFRPNPLNNPRRPYY